MEQNTIGDEIRGFNNKLKQWRVLSASIVKCLLIIAMWVVFIAWIALFFLSSWERLYEFFRKLYITSEGTFFGQAGGFYFLYSGPIIIIALLAVVYIAAFPNKDHEVKKKRFSNIHLRTFPVLVNGPFGIVSAAELIGIFMFVAFIIWSACTYTVADYHAAFTSSESLKEKRYNMVDYTGARIGSIGFFCMAFLFLPITRGSVLLRVIDVPLEQAARYHVWLGHLTMAIFTLHGLFYIILWALKGTLMHEIVRWQSDEIANLPGVIALVAGILMWITSLYPLRKRYFELFFYTHQLYTIFVVFSVFHVGDIVFSCAAGGIYLYMLDRFLRFCQSRRNVGLLSVKCLPCGTLELVLSKPKGMKYNALSFIFLQVRDISWLQWHPFSVSSSPLDGQHHLSVLVKVLGDWTCILKDKCSKFSETNQPGLQCQPYSAMKASVEGPYGHDSAYYLAYESLILVAGGIGISPFLAILSDIIHITKESNGCHPKHILLVWAVKKSKELPLLSMDKLKLISPSFSKKVHLEIQTYVTQEVEPPLEDGDHPKGENYTFSVTKGSSMSGLVGTRNNMWPAIYIFSSTIGFFVLLGLIEALYITPYNVKGVWYKGLLLLMCMIISIVVFGGFVVLLWNRWEMRTLKNQEDTFDIHEISDQLTMTSDEHKVPNGTSDPPNVAFINTIHYGCRPDFSAIFSSVSKHWEKTVVGVIVCGPPSLQRSVAAECRLRTIRRKQEEAIFHFHSHSFDL